MKTPQSALAGIPDYVQHPLAIELMPGGMSEDEFTVFCEDIQERGIIYPITLFEGQVLDGWHRYRAAVRTGTAIKHTEYVGTDPAGYIAACNIHRRKLSSLQRALFGARVHLRNGVTQEETCRRYSISKTVLSMVLKTVDSRNAKLIKRIENDGDFTRGMLREELEELGLVHEHYGRGRERIARIEARGADPEEVEFTTKPTGTQTTKGLRNSVFDVAPAGEDEAEEAEPGTGKRNAHMERRAKITAPQRLKNAYDDLMPDEQETFLRMLWPAVVQHASKTGSKLSALPATKVKLKAVA